MQLQDKVSFVPQAGQRTLWSLLTQKVDAYFVQNKIKKTGNWKLWIKSLVFMSLFIGNYCTLVFMDLRWFISIPLCCVFSSIIAGIGFNIMHDGAHGAFSKKQWKNETAAHSLNFLGAIVYLWKTKHNVIHHTFTNLEGLDEDIDARPFIRTNEFQKWRWFHRYQHHRWYFLFFYSLLYILWVWVNDFRKYFTGKIKGHKFPPMSFLQHVIFWITKVVYAFTFVILPLEHHSFTEWLTGFLTVTLFCGIIIAVVFQLAHVVPITIFAVPVQNKVEDAWFLHQLKTTADFARDNKLISWYTGGLNFQVEHHLFKKISHVHYPAISKIVKDFCIENGIPYIEYPTFSESFAGHRKHLKNMGIKP